MLVELNDLQYENDKYENQQIQYNTRCNKTTSINSDIINNLNILTQTPDECFDFISDDDNFVELDDGFKLYDSTKA